MELSDVIKKMAEMNEYVIEKKLDINIPLMYQAFYEQYKMKNGSYRTLVGSVEYEKAMNERYDWVFEQIQEVIKAKESYNDTYNQIQTTGSIE